MSVGAFSPAMERADNENSLLYTPWAEVESTYPWAGDYFKEVGLDTPSPRGSVARWLLSFEDVQLEDRALVRDEIAEGFVRFVMDRAYADQDAAELGQLSIRGGVAKSGLPEPIELTVRSGEVVCIVGPTGSGKSRLLCDIECLAQGDTPTGRTVWVDGRAPLDAERFLASNKLVAQLSQNMHYVLELGVADFLAIHAQSRHLPSDDFLIATVIDKANGLCGEPFGEEVPVCLLSGGQSRALMIADVALLSRSPIVLIDELENAGINGRAALDLLIQEGKMVFIATHDPALMLHGSRRIVMRDGAMSGIVDRSPFEAEQLVVLERLGHRMEHLRNHLRQGNHIVSSLDEYFELRDALDD